MKKVFVLLIVLLVPFALMAAAVETITADENGGIPASATMPSVPVEWVLEGADSFQKMTVGFYKDASKTPLDDGKVVLETVTNNGSADGVFGSGTVYVGWDIVSGVAVKIGIYANEALNGDVGDPIDWTGTVVSKDKTFGGAGKYTTNPGTDTDKVAEVLNETSSITQLKRSGSQEIKIMTADASLNDPDTYYGTMSLVISLV